jgi:hypothetical protein
VAPCFLPELLQAWHADERTWLAAPDPTAGDDREHHELRGDQRQPVVCVEQREDERYQYDRRCGHDEHGGDGGGSTSDLQARHGKDSRGEQCAAAGSEAGHVHRSDPPRREKWHDHGNDGA